MRSVILTGNSYRYHYKIVPGTKAPAGAIGATDRTADRAQNSSFAVNDEGVIETTLPWSINIGGNAYTAAWTNSNSYITFGASHAQFNAFNLNSSPNKPTLFLGAEDGGWNNFYEQLTTDTARIRFVGSDAPAGTGGNSVWEVTFFDSAKTRGNPWIEVVFGNMPAAKTTALFGIGGGGSSIVPLNGGSLSANQSYVFEGDSTGINWILHVGSFVQTNS